MKSVIIIRHAKSSWDVHTLSDFDRPLNEKGTKEAVTMAQKLIDKKIVVDAFISSPAKRAITTAKYFANAYNIAEENIIQIKELYNASVETLYNVIANTSNKYNNIALFSHNPGITYFVNELTETQIDEMPTCGVFAIKATCKNWEDFSSAKKTFWFFHSPKKAIL
ncbi:MAG: histidine phosphatase family protein [Bacteroidetes bacterium]|nr:histidine phosphatase family protein [Bacteroidota bacterium]MBS1649135.1 histidine phosphatase family protein [Bacteroidota bacterium]